ncbi:MAG: hypothetical protein JRH11_20430 [Deltaproteobacteria bacterium]|nr:hypothetical protein [Deltaproteobacteria bacterium]
MTHRLLLGPLLLLFALSPAAAAADYSPPALNDLVLGSDVIVAGEVVSLSATSFSLRIDDLITGQITTPEIEVQRFTDWTCAARWAPYRVGQRALLFLRRDASGKFQIRSGGGEGEMPIVGDHVYVNSFYNVVAPAGAAAYHRHTVHGGGFMGFAVPKAEFFAALREARRCFVADLGSSHQVQRVRRTCTAPGRALTGSAVGRALLTALSP